MAKLKGDINFTGSLGGLSFYTMRGVDRPVVRTKGGPTKNQIKHSRRMVRVRETNCEFGGRSTLAGWILQAMHPQKALGDPYLTGALNKLLKPVQELDSVSVRGQRNMRLSLGPHFLEGFSLNRQLPFDSIIRHPLVCTVDRETLTARVEVPALLPSINFFPPQNIPMFSLIAVLGVVPDLFYNKYGYKASSPLFSLNYVSAATEWKAIRKGDGGNVLTLPLKTVPPNGDFSLMLSIGIRFGNITDVNTVSQQPYAGAAKILAVI